ncbi:MAG: PorP/SprF family type IX secretion system membrane protein [Chitinophagaceae bacterium]|nr:PorP/SprF family type IX secretion system membrane protein [Chitinophagaceae bacterium]
MKRILAAAALIMGVGYAVPAAAQDPHFSQYFNSPMTINPALIGKDVGDWRLLGVFRSQWWSASVAPYNTTSLSLEKSVHSGSGGKSVFGFGFSLLTDASNSGLLKNNFFTAGAAYNIALDGQGHEHLGVGLEATYANRLVDASKFEFQSQFGSMGFQRSTPSGDPVSISSNKYWDVNMGVRYSKDFRMWGFHLGTAVYHASRPEEGFYSSTKFSVERRVNLQAGARFLLNNKDEVQASVITDLQGQNTVVTLGGVYKARLSETQKLNLGLWCRFQDAIYPYVAFETPNLVVGISYDVVNSQIRNSYSSVQSMEISFGWLFGAKRNAATRPENILPY